jgi:hypothetical protein
MKQRLARVVVYLTMSEADLIEIDMQQAVSVGAEDADYIKVLDKIKSAKARSIHRWGGLNKLKEKGEK